MQIAKYLLLFFLLPLIAVQLASAQTARIQIVHNSPYAEAALVDVYVNDELTLDDVGFRDATPFMDLPADSSLTIDITGSDAADNSSPVFTLADAVFSPDTTLMIIAAGDPLARAGNPAFDLFIASARETATMGGNAEFIVFHGSPDAPPVDVVERTAGALVDSISFGEFSSDYISVPPAEYEIDIQSADSVVASFGADLTSAADSALGVLASGFLAPADTTEPAFGLLAVFADGSTALLPGIAPPAPGTAHVQVVHNSPYEEAALVDVYINSDLALDDVAFRDATPFLELPANVPVTIDVTAADAPDNSSPVFTLEDAELEEDARLLVIAAGDPLARPDNPPFDLFMMDAEEMVGTSGNAEFLVFHGSPDAPTVDVIARGTGPLVDDISFGEFTNDYLSVMPAVYELDIETADNSAVAASFSADLSGAADVVFAVLASGFLEPAAESDPGFGLLAVFPDGTTQLLPSLDEDVSFTLIDAENDTPVPGFDPMPQDAVLDFDTLPLAVNIRANLKDEAESVVFGLNDNASYNTESFAPYALCDDLEGDYLDCALPLGEHVVTATSFSEDSGNGSEVATGSISFTVVNNGNSVSGFMLVDGDTDEDIMALEEGMVLDLDTLPANLNVRAEVGVRVKSVMFELSPTPYSRTEKVPPFALFGDIEGDYFGNTFATGSNTISATPFSAVEGGNEGDSLSMTFEVTGANPGAASVMTGNYEEAAPEEVISLQDEGDDAVPDTFELEGNYPNPFNPTTTITFSVPEAADVRLAVYDMLGREVRVLIDGNVSAGRTEVSFDATGLSTGAYLYRLTTPEQIFVRKMVLVK